MSEDVSNTRSMGVNKRKGIAKQFRLKTNISIEPHGSLTYWPIILDLCVVN
jgi:hypothetical protein